MPYIISGPPGTGKTRTLVESVIQILRGNPEAKLLVVAPSNPAADTLASRLAKTLTRHEMFRLCSPARTFAEVPDDVSSIRGPEQSVTMWGRFLRIAVCPALLSNDAC